MKEFRKMKPEDLEKTLSESRLEVSKALGSVKMGRAVKDHGRIRQLRRTIARVLTIKTEARKAASASESAAAKPKAELRGKAKK